MRNLLLKLKERMPEKEAIKKKIPNAMTIFRGLMAFVIPYIYSLRDPFIIFPTIAVTLATDFGDGALARRWNAVSDNGAKYDQRADKLFGISSIASLLIFLAPSLSVTLSLALPLFLEGAMIAGYVYFNKIKKVKTDGLYKTAKIGRIKTGLLAATTILATLACFCPGVAYAVYPLAGLTVLGQIVTDYVYAKRIYQNKEVEIKPVETLVVEKDNSGDDKVIFKNEKTSRLLRIWKKLREELNYRTLLELPPRTETNNKVLQKTII